jgi:hypothetical protein
MTIRLRHNRYALVAVGKTWAMYWPERAWARLSVAERMALIVGQHALFDRAERSSSAQQTPAGQHAAEHA